MSGINERIIKLSDYYGIRRPSDFAKKVGISQQLAFNYLKSKKKPSTKTLEKIQLCFNRISPEWLLTGKGDMFRDNKKIDNIVATSTSSERVKAVMNYYSLNQNSFSRQIGLLENSTVGRIINNKTKPTLKTLNKITTRFPEINPDWLLTGRGPMLRPVEAMEEAPQTLEEPHSGYGNAREINPAICSACEERERIMVSKDKQIEALECQIEDLKINMERVISEKSEVIKMKDEMLLMKDQMLEIQAEKIAELESFKKIQEDQTFKQKRA